MKNRGFTLIEIMFVVAVIGILAMIALPNFQSSLYKARRSDGKTALVGLQIAQEKLRANCRFYAENLGAANSCDPATVTSSADVTVDFNTTSDEGYYTIAIETGTADETYYKATATAVAGKSQAHDNDGTDCTILTLEVSAANPNGTFGPDGCW